MILSTIDMINENLSLGRALGFTLRMYTKKLHEMFEEAELDLTIEQFVLLNIVHHHKKDLVTQIEVSNMLGKDKSAVLRHIDYLENNQWLCRNDDMNDRRRKILVLTKKGEIHLQKARLLEQKLTKTVLKNVNKDQTTQFMQTMDNILANIFELDENSQELKNI